MFTGLITDVGQIRAIQPLSEAEPDGDQRMVIETHYDTAAIEIGASIACNGICLTVVSKKDDSFSVDVSGETLAVTTAGAWSEGTLVNLEQSLRLGDEMGGHIVSGHVDCTADVIAWQAAGDSMLLRIDAPARFAGLLATKGSITVDGVSLTVNRVADTDLSCQFDINIIPHTQEKTAFRALAVGRAVNLEFDMLARYVARLQQVREQRHA